MKIKKILSGIVAGTLAFSALASLSLFSTSADTEVIWEGTEDLGSWNNDVEYGVNIVDAVENGTVTVEYTAAEDAAYPQIQFIAKVGSAWTWTVIEVNGEEYVTVSKTGTSYKLKLTAEQAEIFSTAKALFMKGQDVTITKITYAGPGSGPVAGTTETIWEGTEDLGSWNNDVEYGVNIPDAVENGYVTVEYTAAEDAAYPQIQFIAKVGSAWTWTVMEVNGEEYATVSKTGTSYKLKLTAEQAEIFATAKALFMKGQDVTITKVTYTSPASTTPDSSVVEPESSVVEPESSVVEPESSIVDEESSVVEPESSIVDEEDTGAYTFGVVAGEGGTATYSAPTEVITDPVEGTNSIDVTGLSEGWKSEQKGKLVKRMIKGGEADTPVFDNTTAIELMDSFMSVKVTISGVGNSKLCTSGSIVLNGTNTSWEQHEWNINNSETFGVEDDLGNIVTITEISKNQYTIEYKNADGTSLFSKEDKEDPDTFFSVAIQNWGWSADEADFAKIDFVVDGVAIYDADGNVVWQDGEIATVDQEATYPTGTEFICTAKADAGYEFVNWTDVDGVEVSTDAECTYTLGSQDELLTANFQVAAEDDSSTTDEDSSVDDDESSVTDEDSSVDDESKVDPGTSSTNKGNTSTSTTNKGSSSSSSSGSTSGSNSSPNTGASALAFVGLALAGSAIVVSKKKK